MFTHSRYNSFHLLTPNSQSFPPPPPFSLGNHKSVLYVCESVSVSQINSFVLYFILFYLFKKNKFIYLIYFWLHWVFIAARGLSLVVMSRGYSSLWCAGFSLRWLLLLRSAGSRYAGFSSCGSQALEHRLSSCSARA